MVEKNRKKSHFLVKHASEYGNSHTNFHTNFPEIWCDYISSTLKDETILDIFLNTVSS